MIKVEMNTVVIVQSSTLRDILDKAHYDGRLNIDVGMNAVVVEVPDNLCVSQGLEEFKAFVIKTIRACHS